MVARSCLAMDSKLKLHALWNRIVGPIRLRKRIASGGPIKIVIGAGRICQRGWIRTEVDYLDVFNLEHWDAFFQPDTIDAINCEHVWVYFPFEAGIQAAKNCYKYLKPGGNFRVSVPDGLFPDQAYIDYVKPGGTGVLAETHQMLYTYKTMKDQFEKAGFTVQLLEYWDEDGTFHYTPWDESKGFVRRTRDNDPRNQDGVIRYSSILIDAVKPLAPVPLERVPPQVEAPQIQTSGIDRSSSGLL